jgi:hypothetical protein
VSDVRAVVLFERRDDPDLAGIAAALKRAIGADDTDDAPAGAIALPVPDEGGPRIDRADVVIVLDGASAHRAREAGATRIVALLPWLTLDWDDTFDVDLVLVAHEALIADVVARGANAARVHACGPIAPEGWAPGTDRAALRSSLAPNARADAPWVVVRGAAIEDDPAPALVQLSLAGSEVVWLFDVGGDPELARSLRRIVPGYGLDALMFADGPDALRAYQAADAVLARAHGPEAIRAIAVGAALVAMPPRDSDLRVAHVLETAGVIDFADAPATLAVTLDAALEQKALEAARAASLKLDAGAGATRAAELVEKLLRGEIGTAGRAGLPAGLERISEPDRARGNRASELPPKKRDDVDKQVDDELAALRKKLGL